MSPDHVKTTIHFIVGAVGLEPTQTYLYAEVLQTSELNQCSAHPFNHYAPHLGNDPSYPWINSPAHAPCSGSAELNVNSQFTEI